MIYINALCYFNESENFRNVIGKNLKHWFFVKPFAHVQLWLVLVKLSTCMLLKNKNQNQFSFRLEQSLQQDVLYCYF